MIGFPCLKLMSIKCVGKIKPGTYLGLMEILEKVVKITRKKEPKEKTINFMKERITNYYFPVGFQGCHRSKYILRRKLAYFQ